MPRYLFRRTIHALILVLVVVALSSLILQLAPGDVLTRYRSPGMDPLALDHTRHALGLDAPAPKRFLLWMGATLRGEFGQSLVQQRDVSAILRETVPRTLLLTGLAFLVQLALGGLLGVVAARRRGRAGDTALRGVALFFYALPSFYFAYVLIALFSLRFDLLPSSGIATIGLDAGGWAGAWDRGRHLVLPVVVLGVGGAASWARYTRGAISDALAEAHIVTARSKGAGENRVVFVHALRTALPQLITLVGVSVPFLLGGAVVVEKVFAWPGIGALLVDSIFARDYPVVLAINTVSAVAMVMSSLCVDLTYGILDPRIKIANSAGLRDGGA